MAIDQEIERKVNAYRNNPQALMQRYQQNQQLIDLLALQKLKSEKDAAAKEMQMQMAQDPQTIKQQRERELLDRTKQDMVQQQAGIMQMAQQRQQKNMQQVAKQGAASPQQVQQVASGLGALAQRQMPQRMAAGGVVALQAGGGITQEMIDAYRRSGGQGRRARASMTDDEIRAVLQARMGGSEVPEGSERVLTRRGTRTRPIQTAPLEATLADQAAGEATVGPLGATEGAVPPTAERAPEAAAPVVETPAAPVPTGGPDDGLRGVAATATPTETNTGGGGLPTITTPTLATATGDRGAAINRQFGLSGANAGSAGTALNNARDDAADFMGRAEKQERFDRLIGRLEDLDARYSDPARQRDEQISAFLRGTAGGGSFGTTMAGGSAGMAAEKEKQYTNARQRLQDIIGLNETAINVDTTIAGQAQRSGDAAANRAAANAQQAARIAAQMTEAEMDQAYRMADLRLRAEQGNLSAAVDRAKIEADRDLRMAIEKSGNEQASMALLERNTARQTEIMNTVLNDVEYLGLLRRAQETGKPADRAAAQAKQDQLILVANIIMNRGRLFDTERMLYERLGMPYNRPGAGASAGGDGGQLDAEVQALLERYGG
jgi:hypothetical protein